MTGANHLLSACLLAFVTRVSLSSWLALALGALLPDVDRLTPRFHRTLTHWWPLPAITMLLAALTPRPEIIWAFATGWMLHLAGDLLTPAGIPLGPNPFRRRRGLGLFATGSSREHLLVLLLLSGVLAVTILRDLP
jgi:hypothetical protein